MKLKKIIRAISNDRRVILPFQYYTECKESIFCLVFSSHSSNAKIYMHYDKQQRFIAKTILSDCHIDSQKINPFNELEKKIPIEDKNFEELFFDMHIASKSSRNIWYDKNILKRINNIYPKPPVIIGGCGRSGTTLLLSILGAHPSIHAINDEIYVFYPMPFRLQRLEDALIKEKSDEKKRWCEKTPKNVRSIEDILTLFENNVKFIHIVRDPRDVITSIHPKHPDRYWVSIERWVEDVKVGLESKKNTLIVRYEDLVQNTEKTVRIICDYINEPFYKKMLDIKKYSTIQKNVAWGKNVKSIHDDSVERWKKPEYQDKIGSLMQNDEAVKLMDELGYYGFEKIKRRKL